MGEGLMASLSKEVKALAEQPWFPVMMRELGYVKPVMCCECVYHEDEEPGMVYCPKVAGGWVDDDFYCRDGKKADEK